MTSYFAVIWLMYVMNSVIAWYSFSLVFLLMGALGVILCSLVKKKHVLTNGRQKMLLLVFLYMVWEIVNHASARVLFSAFFTFVPLLFILLWPIEELKKTYEVFRKVVVFFAIGSSIIVILYYLGQLSMIPHYEMPPTTSTLHSNRGDIYEIYIIFPQLVVPNDLTRRACGMTLEGGHFSIVLGFIYLIDRYLQKRINPIIIICAVLTFSPAFFLVVFFVEIVNIRKDFKKKFLYLSLSCFIVSFIYLVLPSDIKDLIYHMTYEKNVEGMIVSNKTGSLDDALDERANQAGKKVYDNLDFGQKLFGGEFDKDMVLSDYRGFIVNKGLISLLLVILISFYSLSGAPWPLKVSLFLTMLMIMLHRAWFFYEPFPYLMSFIVSSCYIHGYSNNLKRNIIVI